MGPLYVRISTSLLPLPSLTSYIKLRWRKRDFLSSFHFLILKVPCASSLGPCKHVMLLWSGNPLLLDIPLFNDMRRIIPTYFYPLLRPPYSPLKFWNSNCCGGVADVWWGVGIPRLTLGTLQRHSPQLTLIDTTLPKDYFLLCFNHSASFYARRSSH